MLTNLETLRRLRNYRQDVEQPPADMEIDTDSDAARSAAAVVSRFGLTPQHLPDRHPNR